MVVWIIGMSGAGKTEVGRIVYRELKAKQPNTVFLDGDIFRAIMGDDVGHTLDDRRKNAERICRMCAYLESEGINVVCAILSIFHESQKWNRENLKDYFEVYLEVSLDELIRRDSKGLYGRALRGEIDNVVGIDIEFPEPLNPDLVIRNEAPMSVSDSAMEILSRLLERYPALT